MWTMYENGNHRKLTIKQDGDRITGEVSLSTPTGEINDYIGYVMTHGPRKYRVMDGTFYRRNLKGYGSWDAER